jgi:hypothetical protein
LDCSVGSRDINDIYSHEGLDQLDFSLTIDVTEPCCECPMKYGNDLSVLLVEVIPKDFHHFQVQWSGIDFAPLHVEENALVLLGNQSQ